MGVAAQLTGLKQLVLRGMPLLTNPIVLQLTALTALQELTLCPVRGDQSGRITHHGPVALQNKVRVVRCDSVDTRLKAPAGIHTEHSYPESARCGIMHRCSENPAVAAVWLFCHR